MFDLWFYHGDIESDGGYIMLREIIYDYLENNEDNYIYKNKEFTASPSSICDCRRKIYYRKKGYTQSNPISAPSKLKMEMGNMIHNYIKKILEDKNYNTFNINYIEGEQLKCAELGGLLWWYRVDNLIEIDQKKYMIEVKSVFMSGWSEVQNNARIENILQLYLYMLFEKIDNGIILYIDRSSGYMKEYNFTLRSLQDYDNDLWKQIEGLNQLALQVNNDTLPERDFQAYMKRTESLSWEFQKDKKMYKTDFHCNYCSFKDYCWKDIIEIIQPGQFYIDGKII